MESWAHNFMYRVNDISSLGNVTSTQNRFVQAELRSEGKQPAQDAGHPAALGGRWHADSARARSDWANEEKNATGFHVYRDGKKLTTRPLPVAARSYTDRADGRFRYAVSAVTAQGESLPSVPWLCEAGHADRTPPQVMLISPPSSVPAGQPASVKVRALDGRAYDLISATLYLAQAGRVAVEEDRHDAAREVDLRRRDSRRGHWRHGGRILCRSRRRRQRGSFPRLRPQHSLSLIVGPNAGSGPAFPAGTFEAERPDAHLGGFGWQGLLVPDLPQCEAGLHRRDRLPSLPMWPRQTRGFKDNGFDLDGRPLKGAWYYRVTSADMAGAESRSAAALKVSY